jgi:hypothetical protein
MTKRISNWWLVYIGALLFLGILTGCLWSTYPMRFDLHELMLSQQHAVWEREHGQWNHRPFGKEAAREQIEEERRVRGIAKEK